MFIKGVASKNRIVKFWCRNHRMSSYSIPAANIVGGKCEYSVFLKDTIKYINT